MVIDPPRCKAANCAGVLIKGPYQVVVQLLVDVQFVYISCIQTLLTIAPWRPAVLLPANKPQDGGIWVHRGADAQASEEGQAAMLTSQLYASLLRSSLPVLAGVHIAAELCSVI